MSDIAKASPYTPTTVSAEDSASYPHPGNIQPSRSPGSELKEQMADEIPNVQTLQIDVPQQKQDDSASDSESEVSVAHQSQPLRGNSPDTAISPVETRRCVRNIDTPTPGLCVSNIDGDDRHYISSFFGRNKACSTNIPDSFYLLLCRKCMQFMRYKLKGKRVKEIKTQLKAIRHVVNNLKADGRWVLFEVQFTKAEFDRRQDPDKYQRELNAHNNEVKLYRKAERIPGKKATRRNLRTPLVPVPKWLVPACTKREDHDYNQVHPERNPARFSFSELCQLLDAIEERCDVLPNIECLPVTHGELDALAVSECQGACDEIERESEKEKARLASIITELNNDPNNEPRVREMAKLQHQMRGTDYLVQKFEGELISALTQAERTKWMIPARRPQAPRKSKAEDAAKEETETKEQDKAFVDLEAATRTPRPGTATVHSNSTGPTFVIADRSAKAANKKVDNQAGGPSTLQLTDESLDQAAATLLTLSQSRASHDPITPIRQPPTEVQTASPRMRHTAPLTSPIQSMTRSALRRRQREKEREMEQARKEREAAKAASAGAGEEAGKRAKRRQQELLEELQGDETEVDEPACKKQKTA